MTGPHSQLETNRDALKRQAAEYAVELIEPGMVVGLGSGSTARFAVEQIAALLKKGVLRDVIGIPTSRRVEQQARQLGIPLASSENPPMIDLTIDGADEADLEWNCIKGGGGALLHEKVVAQASRREVIVVDEAKMSPRIGTRWPVPIEVIPFAAAWEGRHLESLGASIQIRRQADNQFYRTDEGNLILDCRFGPLDRPAELAAQLAARAGIVEHGLFLNLATDLVIAGPEGIKHLIKPTT